MKRSKSTIGLGLALVALAVFGAGTATHAAPGDQVPFQGFLNIVVTDVQPGPGSGEATLAVDFSGAASPLGLFTGTTAVVLEVSTLAYHGSTCLNSVNGVDSICIDFVGQFTPMGGPDVPFAHHFVVTGGTGRFSGATGAGNVAGVVVDFFSPAPNSGSGTFTGTVSRPHAL